MKEKKGTESRGKNAKTAKRDTKAARVPHFLSIRVEGAGAQSLF